MSGGSMNYIYCQIDEYAEMFQDPELIRLAKDFAKLAHDCEWMHSGDYSDGEYRKSVIDFKSKWLKKPDVRLQKIITEEVEKVRTELLSMLGGAILCKDCRHFEKSETSEYGDCINCIGYMVHGYDYACDKFEGKDNA